MTYLNLIFLKQALPHNFFKQLIESIKLFHNIVTSVIKNVKVVVDDAKKVLKLEDAVLRPVYADANELFLSTPLSFENFTTDLVVFDKKGKLLARYAGLKDDPADWVVTKFSRSEPLEEALTVSVTCRPADWAVTKHYLVQASATGDVLIYDRSNGKKVFNARVNQFVPRYLYSMGGDMILACDNVTKFYILKLE